MERSDLHDLLVLVGAGVVDHLDILVRQLLGLLLQLLLIVLGDLAVQPEYFPCCGLKF